MLVQLVVAPSYSSVAPPPQLEAISGAVSRYAAAHSASVSPGRTSHSDRDAKRCSAAGKVTARSEARRDDAQRREEAGGGAGSNITQREQ